jgi:hypothetical protein
MKNLLLALVALTFVGSAPDRLVAQVQEEIEIPQEFMDALRKDVRQMRTQAMQAAIVLEPGQSATFWPIYEDYQEDLEEITQTRTELIRDYAMMFETMSDDQAVDLGHRAMELRREKEDLVRRYFDRIADDVSGKAAGQFYQVEQQVQMLIDLQLAMEIPIIGG